MASQLKVDTITGVTTAGEITITLENSESQILQKGLAKVTANITLVTVTVTVTVTLTVTVNVTVTITEL